MSVSIKNIKVMIAEDDKDICDMYGTAFMRKGFKVFLARDGKSAIEKFNQKKPDIILLDIMMPGADGYQVLREIRKKHDKYVPVIMLTNLNMEHFTKREALDNVDAYLVKSNFTPGEIVENTMEVMKMNKMIDSDAG